MQKLTAAALAGLLLFPSHASLAQDRPVYGAQLEGFSYPYPVKRFDVQSQGQKLSMAYMDVAPTGASKNKTVVLLHGKNFCGATWEKTISVLSGAGYRVIAPDQIGFCASSKPEGYQFSLAQLADNTHSLLKSLQIKNAVIMGHSMGGMLATRYALMYPEETSQLVLVNPIGLEDWQQKGVPYATVDALYRGELKTNFDSIKAYQQRMYYNGQWKPEYDRWAEMQAGMYAGEGRDIVAYNQAQTSEMIFTQPVVHEFSNISVPTLLLIGGKDRTAPGSNRAPKELQEKLGLYHVLGQDAAKSIPQATLVEFPALGHSPQVESPDEFHKALLQGLK